MNRYFLIGIILLGIKTSPALVAQDQTIFYTADTTGIFPNPERGWYGSYVPPCCDSVPQGKINGAHDLIKLNDLMAMRNSEEAITLLRDVVKIQQYSGDIPQSRLEEIQTDLNTIRQAGMKVLWRICYNYGVTYGEAPGSVISRHLDQLKPIIQNNADVIFCVQAGLFGGSGEGCCNSFFIHDQGFNNGWSSLKTEAVALYNKLISCVPASRSIALRYPRYKYQMMGWANSNVQALADFPSAAVPLTESNAFDGSLQARLGFMQDNFAGDINGYGFFNAWEQKDRDFTEEDSKFSLMEGELSWGTDFNKNNAVDEMSKFHFTAFHFSTYGGGYEGGDMTIPTWKENGPFNTIGIKLGYRFRLISAKLPNSLSKDSIFNINLKMANDGWARIMNPRKVEIIFLNKSTGKKYIIDIDGDGRGNRLWLPGPGETKTLNISKSLPEDMPESKYDLFLNLPDPYPSLHDRPEYSIRLANQNTWDEETGFNSMKHTIKILK